MVKHLTKHGNSLALVIDKPILELLGIDAETPLSVTTNGTSLVICRAPEPGRKKAFAAALAEGNKRYGKMLKRLAE